jgi:hypothetical protein
MAQRISLFQDRLASIDSEARLFSKILVSAGLYASNVHWPVVGAPGRGIYLHHTANA